MTRTDEDLMLSVQAREADAFDALVARHRETLRRHLSAMVRDTNAADDLLQETLLRVWTRAEQWNGRGAVKPWLFRIAANLALNHLRALRRRREQPLEILANASDEEEISAPTWLLDTAALDPETLVEQAERQTRLRRLVETLPAGKRAVLHLVYDAGMELREVADTLGIPPGTVKSRLHHARRRLARAWQDTATEGEESP